MSDLRNVLNRDVQEFILLAELGGLIHDVGKLSEEFVTQQSIECYQSQDQKCSFDHEDVQRVVDQSFLSQLGGLLQDQRWRNRLKYNRQIQQLRDAPDHLAHFISGHCNINSGKGLLALVTRCDQVDSGVDKGFLQNDAKQHWNATYIASAFGYERHRLDGSSTGLRDARQQWADDVYPLLDEILSQKASIADKRDRILESTAQAFCQALGETRRAANDITLWDHAYSVASLLKVAVAWVLLTQQWPSNLRMLQWRILRVSFDGLSFLERAHRIPDILGRREAIQKGLDSVRRLLEVDIPLGNEIYRDENGSAFVLPDVPDLLDWKDNAGKTLRECIAEVFSQEVDREIYLELGGGFSNPNRYAIYLGQLVGHHLPSPPRPDDVEAWWQSAGDREFCTVCGLRPQGSSPKSQERRVCEVCERRRQDRSQEWAKTLTTTVWSDEVADENGRLALVVARLDMDRWLNGEMLYTTLGQPVPADGYEKVVAQLAKELEQNVSPDNTMLKKLAPEAFKGQQAQQFYKAVVEERDIHGISQNIASSNYRTQAERLLLFLLRKSPSFARIRRIWQTVRQFWQEVCPTDPDYPLSNSLVADVVGTRDDARLELRGHIQPQRPGDTLGPYHTYELVLPQNVRMSVVWDEKNGRFITADNLDYLATPDLLGKHPQEVLRQGETFTLEVPVGYGGANRVWGEITLTANAAPISGSYVPVIPILAEPRTFMALIPADRALEVVQAIRKKYEREMGKVRNRLPLHIGIVFAGRRVPLRAILDAGRRLLRQQGVTHGWEVKEAVPDSSSGLPNHLQGDPHFQRCQKVVLSRDGRRLTWYVPLKMGDGTTDDHWYPYVFLDGGARIAGRKDYFQAPNPWTGQLDWVIHARELQSGDRVFFTPATLDWIWLDTPSRRFEVVYDSSGRRRDRPQRPYLLDDLERMERLWEIFQKLSLSQQHQVLAEIEGARERWSGPNQDPTALWNDPVFRQRVTDILAAAEWPESSPWSGLTEEERESLVQAAVRGELADWAELHIQILKEKGGRS